MSIYGLSALEIQHLIERALLPDKCECDIANGYLTLHLCTTAGSGSSVILTPVRLESLSTSRAIAELVGEARYQLATFRAEPTTAARKNRG